MLDFVDVEQNTDEWFELRAGRLTSSKLGVIMAGIGDMNALIASNLEIEVHRGSAVHADIDKAFDEGVIPVSKRTTLYKKVDANIKKGVAKTDKELLGKEKKSLAFTAVAQQYAVNIAVEQITGKPISSNYSNTHMERGHEQEPIARMLYEEETFCEVSNGGFFSSDFVGCSPDGLVFDCGAIEIKSVISSVHYANVKRQDLDPAYRWQCLGNLMFTGRDWLDFVSYCADFPEDKQLFIHRIRKANCEKEFAMIKSRIEEFEALVASTKLVIESSDYASNQAA
jgi:hypothetical protein